MSHIAKIDTKIKDISMLKKALESMQMGFVETSNDQALIVHGYGKGEDIEGCFMEIKTGSKYGIGVRKVGENYEFVADWWAIETFTGQKQEELLDKITRRYAYETILDKVHGMGYSVVYETQDFNNNVKLTVRRWK